MFWYFGVAEGFGARADAAVFVQLYAAQWGGFAAGCDEDVFCGVQIVVHANFARPLDAPVTGQMCDFVLFEQARDAAGETFDDLILAFEHRRQIELYAGDIDAVRGEDVSGFVEFVAGLEQGFAGDAANPQASAAEARLL